MRFTDIFIKRPILAISISFLIALLGVQAVFKMQVREYPEMTNTVVTVSTSYYGASADLIQGFITQPLEQAIAQADNIDFMTSSTQLGSSTITAYMKLNTNPNAALSDILAKVNSVRSQLPKESEDPSVTMSTGSTTAVLYIGFTSPELNASQITDYLERVIKPQLFTVGGVSKVDMYGGTKYALRVWLDPAKMAAFNLTAADVMSVLNSNNYQSATGQATGYFTLYNGNAETQVNTTEELERLVVATRDGKVIRLADIAKVSLEKSHDTYRATANGREAVVLAINAAPTANPINIAHDVLEMLPSLKSNMPSTMEANVLYDSTVAINESISEVIKTIAEAAAIVLVVITLFLGSFRAVIIPIITIPLSLIGVVMVMQMFGFSINLMTLLAMVLAIGLVVDDAIVVLENVDRHVKEGEEPFRAAIIGTREIAVPVIAMTVTLAAVYAPIALMGGITGSLFKEFALTLAGAVFVSGIIALTLSPMMCAKMLKANEEPGKFESKVHHLLDRMTVRYDAMLHAVMQKRIVVVLFAVIVFASLPMLFKFIPSELAPNEDKGVMAVLGTAPSNVNLDYIQGTMEQVNKVLDEQPEVAFSQVFSGVFNANQAFGIASMVPWSQREASQKEVLERVGKLVENVPGMSITTFQFPELPGASSGLPIQFVITTPNNFESLYQVASEILTAAQGSGRFVYSELDLQYDSATMKIKIDKDKAGAYGITMQDIGITLGTMMSDGYVNRIDLDGRSYEVIPQVERKYRLNPESIKGYYVRAADGQSIPLGSLISIEVVGEPRALPHFNQLNSATIGAVLMPGTTMGNAIAWLDATASEKLPQGYRYDYMGEARQFVTEGSALYATFALALAIIFLVLAIQFESARDPLVIMVSVPLAISGALIALAWGAATMNIYSQVGLITLVGLITKHGILICEVAKEEQLLHGRNRMEAVMAAAKVRLRPILMTTAAMIAGLIPLLYATGAGAAQRFSIGIVIVAGLAIGTLFTLFVLPVIYTYLASEHKPLPVFDESIPPKAKGSH
ncbi:multidrug efflux pump [Aeromonas hydrophila]|uniref:Acriflavin resistance plasma membrane protein n=1 Tax=Aeromonas hydrophila subsp. hydrophila (strain ATCC 7966 / DSM 30187 / BCRC 13018 / CCUG 14551 / JCM 1027 / KCTC 2358 / NCIMB 9240 / NCTC 8049) TaxID=380703 RepID=A0KR19_AERHH|nr:MULTISPECIES: multidrug efflux RND transporter permease subunit [Aeromonas]ABK38722.1 acriflavin resistance plasma membrane protein [Aeromonas hydrophila subsp. hydrophila ATCC 7966]AVP86594.1 transporter [Aeromonas hydrophila]EGX6955551.1 multidrug efflux RND transporter permease subunit [Aeromonas hydrophila]EHK5440558.1 multidrug efflux RND transporter permease subunit [Aeromonas hydrophila]EHK5441115.1 multidrug efflux RND transporter permease subunit [Aeromonas hydrophila]